MKQDTNFSAAWKQVVGSRTTTTRQTKQSILNSMLRAFLFLTFMVMGANGAWADQIPGSINNGVDGTAGSNATWTQSTKTYSWSASTGNAFTVNGITDLSSCNYLVLNTSDLDGEYRVYLTIGTNTYHKRLTQTGVVLVSLTDDKWLTDVWNGNSGTNLPDRSSVTLYFAGISNSGSVKVNSIYVDNVGYTISWDASIASGKSADAWYTLGDNTEKIREQRVGVPGGVKVSYHATDGTNNNWVVNGWRKDETQAGWLKYGSIYDVEDINSDLNVYPEFQNTHIYIAAAELGGSAKVYASGDGGKTNISGTKYKSWEMNSGVLFEATPDPGYEFVGWKEAGGTTNPLEVSEHESGTTYTRTATFNLLSSPSTVEADFDDRGKGGNVTMTSGVMHSTGTSDNVYNIFVFPTSDNNKKNVTTTADNYSGIMLNSQGDAYRIVIFCDNTSNATKVVDVAATANSIVHQYSWSDLGLTADKVSNITRIAVAGNRQSSDSYVTFSDAFLVHPDKPVVILNNDAEQTVYMGKTLSLGSTVSEGAFHTWDLYSDAECTNLLGFLGYMSSLTFDPSDVKNNDGNSIAVSENQTYYLSAGAGKGDGNGGYVWADNKVYSINVQPARASYNVTFSAPAVFGAPLPDGVVTAQVKNGDGTWSDLTSGNTVLPGATVRFTAKQFSENAAHGSVGESRLILDKWSLNDVEFKGEIPATGIVWNEGTSTYEMVVDDDVDFKALYALSYKLHFADATSVNNENKIATYEHGTVTAAIGADAINEWSGFRGNGTSIDLTATPSSGYILDHWEAYLKGAGNDPVWSSNNMGGGATLKLNVAGSTFNNAWGNDIYVKPVFKEIVYSQQEIIVNDKTREYIVYIPASISNGDEDVTVPVVFSLHGTGNDNYPDTYGVQNFNDLAESKKFIVVYPRGIEREFPAFGATTRGWKSDGTRNEDVVFFEKIVDKLKQDGYSSNKYNIDADRIYISGFSNGGMMAYTTAFTSDYFAAFSSISGIQLNEFHLQHHGWPWNNEGNTGAWTRQHPVPFMHIHGTKDDFVKYTLVPTIVDNMVYRNGCNPVPTKTSADNGANFAGNPMKYTKYEYAPLDAQGKPYVYYEIGSGMTASDTGMGHNYDVTIGGEDSKLLEWEFMSQHTRPDNSNYGDRLRQEFRAKLNQSGFKPNEHGWTVGVGSILAQYGETTGSQNDRQNTYHSLQFGPGIHNIDFNVRSTSTNKSDQYITVRLIKLANLNTTDGNAVTCDNVELVNKNYSVTDENTQISFNFTVPDSDPIGEYQLIISCNKDVSKTSVTDVAFYDNTRADHGTLYQGNVETDFKGYFSFHNRLIAQWNFDLCDGVRFNKDAIERSSLWTANYGEASSDGKYGIITYSYNQALSDCQLTYGDGNNTVIPVASGLKFTAAPNAVRVQVTVSNGEVVKTQLVIDAGVQMTVPYVINSYRNDKGSDFSPYTVGQPEYKKKTDTSVWVDKYIDENGDFCTDQTEYNWNVKEEKYEGKNGAVVDQDAAAAAIAERAVKRSKEENDQAYLDNKDCLHHINRDILYVTSEPDIWNCITNKCADETTKDLFNSGGAENIDGKNWEKLNFTGNQGTPCTITFSKGITIDRLAVNRNMLYSFYTEYMSDFGYEKPQPGMRIIGSPTGSKIANLGATYATYEDAIAMTYGGWSYKENKYKDVDGNELTDGWGSLTVYDGADKKNINLVPTPTDGFPVYSAEENPAFSETVNPVATVDPFDDRATTGRSYHDKSDGKFLLDVADRIDGTDDKPYLMNYNPWTLPCRGSYAKFEPTYPGVINFDFLMESGHDYFIADEFGCLVKNNVYTKAGTRDVIITNNNGHFTISKKDNVKFSFDVYPGKTYYIFSNDANMGIAGFYFEPYVYRKYHSLATAGDDPIKWELERTDVGIKTATLNNVDGYNGPGTLTWGATNGWDVEGYTNATSGLENGKDVAKQHDFYDSYNASFAKNNDPDVGGKVSLDNKAVHVIYNRYEGVGGAPQHAFVANTWNTICLPFSMNNLQLQHIFGGGVKVVLLRDVQLVHKNGYNKTTANFVYHMNQDIIAGYPYLIYPTKNVDVVEANVYVGTGNDQSSTGTTPSIVVISGKGPNLVTYDGKDYDGLPCYDFKGNFAQESLPMGSYVVATDGKLTRLPQGQTAAPFRAFLKYDHEKESDGQFHARDRVIEAVNYGIEVDADVTAIDDVLLQSGIVGAKTDVYSINGQMIRKHTDNLQGLKKGLYIVNGKKYFVK